VEKATLKDQTSEDSRRQKRLKRRSARNVEGAVAAEADAAADAALAALEAEKKTTKKERKLAESKFSEQQQHKSANEAARMAVSGLLGSRLGKNKKTYGWMNSGKGGIHAVTPGVPVASGNTSVVGTPGPERPRAGTTKEKQSSFGQWDEEKDTKIQARDVLLVLESDGRASKSYVRGLSLPEKADS
jgi:hypothetical protein